MLEDDAPPLELPSSFYIEARIKSLLDGWLPQEYQIDSENNIIAYQSHYKEAIWVKRLDFTIFNAFNLTSNMSYRYDDKSKSCSSVDIVSHYDLPTVSEVLEIVTKGAKEYHYDDQDGTVTRKYNFVAGETNLDFTTINGTLSHFKGNIDLEISEHFEFEVTSIKPRTFDHSEHKFTSC